MKVLTDLIHAGTGLSAGLLTGIVVDTLAPEYNKNPEHMTKEDFLRVYAEITLQVVAGSMVTAGYLKFLSSFSKEAGDSAQGFAYLFAIVASQPKLQRKVSMLCDTTNHYFFKKTLPTKGTMPSAHANQRAMYPPGLGGSLGH